MLAWSLVALCSAGSIVSSITFDRDLEFFAVGVAKVFDRYYVVCNVGFTNYFPVQEIVSSDYGGVGGRKWCCLAVEKEPSGKGGAKCHRMILCDNI